MTTSLAATNHLLRDETDLQRLRAFLKQLPHESNMGDFEEQIQLPTVRVTTRLWERADELIACAYVDGGNNLSFDIADGYRSEQLEQEIVDWGLACVKQRNTDRCEDLTLDASCSADDLEQLRFLEKFGFVRETIRSLKYSRSLAEPINEFPFPPGFSLRSVTGENEVDALVALHRAAFGTDNMTVEERLAIMRAPNYAPDLDLVAVAPSGELCAFCICGFEEGDEQIGFTDPIGTHPNYQRLGLGKAIVSAGLRALKDHGATSAETGTSSENLPMQKLAERLGFVCVAESLWFSKKVT
jgi:ribosomal protein S18 acetylase RimI-like enzyme